jgi:ADP-heptose:LPS heptosyltransferase
MNRNKFIIKTTIFLSNLLSYFITSIYGFRKPDKFNNSLLVINTEKLGDLVLAADFLISLRNKNKYENYDLLVPEDYISLFDWKEINYNPITINKTKYRYNFYYRFDFIKQIRQKKYLHVINITQERGMINEELTLLSGAEIKTAMKKSSLYLPEVMLKRNNRHYSEILDSPYPNEYKRLSYYLEKNNIDQAVNDKIFGNIDVLPESVNIQLKKKNYIIIAPMTSEIDRSWGIDNYKHLCALIPEDIILIGRTEEREILDTFTAKNIKNLAGELNFNQIAILMRNCSLYIGNDSGLTHLAHQIMTPLIAIIGGGKFGKFFPYKERADAVFLFHQMDCFGCDWNCIYDKKYCLINVTPESVYERIKSLIRQLNEN